MRKALKITFISLGSILGLILLAALLLSTIFEDDVKRLAIKNLNQQLKTELRIDEDKVKLSLLKDFPLASIRIEDVEIASALNPDSNLLELGLLSLQFKPKDIFKKNYNIKKVHLEDGFVAMKIDRRGNKSFDILKSNKNKKTDEQSEFKFLLQQAILKNVDVLYQDSKNKQTYHLLAKKAKVKGNFQKEAIDLEIAGDLKSRRIQIKEDRFLENKDLEIFTDIKLKQEQAVYAFRNTQLNTGNSKFDIDGLVSRANSGTHLDFEIANKETSIADLLNLLPEKYAEFQGWKSSGSMTFKGKIQGTLSGTENPQMQFDFGLNNGKIAAPQWEHSISNARFHGSITNGGAKNLSSSRLWIRDFTGIFASSPFAAEIDLRNFKKPELGASLKGSFPLDEILALVKVEPQTLRGKAILEFQDVKLKTPLHNLAKMQIEGPLNLKGDWIEVEGNRLSSPIIEAHFEKENALINRLAFHKGNSDLKGKGQLKGWKSLFSKKSNPELHFDLNLESSLLTSQDLQFKQGKRESTSVQTKKSENPLALSANIRWNIKKIKHAELLLANTSFGMRLRGETLQFQNFGTETAEGKLQLSGNCDFSNLHDIRVSANGIGRDLNIKALFSSFENFGQQNLTAENIAGKVNTDYEFTCQFGKGMKLKPASLEGSFQMRVRDGELINYQALNSLSKFVDIEELQHIRFSEMSNHIKIENEVIDIPSMVIQNSALTLSLVGEHHFNNHIDYSIKLNLMDVLEKKWGSKIKGREFAFEETSNGSAINLFLRMTGLSNKPKIKLDRKTSKERLGEEENKPKLPNLKEFFKNKKDSQKRQKPPAIEDHPLSVPDTLEEEEILDEIDLLDWEEEDETH